MTENEYSLTAPAICDACTREEAITVRHWGPRCPNCQCALIVDLGGHTYCRCNPDGTSA